MRVAVFHRRQSLPPIQFFLFLFSLVQKQFMTTESAISRIKNQDEHWVFNYYTEYLVCREERTNLICSTHIKLYDRYTRIVFLIFFILGRFLTYC